MLKTRLLHPEILEVLAKERTWFKSTDCRRKLSILDRNASERTRVFLNFRNLLSAVDVLTVLVDYIPVEKALLMLPADDTVPEIHQEFSEILGSDTPIENSGGLLFTTRLSQVILASSSPQEKAGVLPKHPADDRCGQMIGDMDYRQYGLSDPEALGHRPGMLGFRRRTILGQPGPERRHCGGSSGFRTRHQ